MQHVFVNLAYPFFCFLHGCLLLIKAHILSSFSLFLFFNESSSSLFPYFYLSAHLFPYFFKPLVFLLISSNPNASRLCQPCSPTSFVFYMPICYSQKHILSSSSLFLFFNELSFSLFPYFSSSVHCLPYFFKLLVFLLISVNPNASRLCQHCSPSFFCFLHDLLLIKEHLIVFLLISLLQRVVFLLISLFL
jgi:hypothetical protein